VKIKTIPCCLILTASVAFISCKKNDEKAATSTSALSTVDPVAEKVPAKPVVVLSVEERAAKLGFAKYLPKDTQAVISVFNARDVGEQLKGLGIFQMISAAHAAASEDLEGFSDEENLQEAEQAEEENPAEAEEFAAAAPDPWTLLGQEITVAFGKSTSEQVGNFSILGQRFAYLQAKAFGKAIRVCEKAKDMSDFSRIYEEEMSTKLLKSLIEDEKLAGALLDKAEMLPLMIAFRAKEGELEQAAQLVNSSMMMFAMAGEMVKPIDFETGGAKFSGYQLSGEKVAKMLEAQREAMEKEASPELVERVFAAVKRNNIIFATGTIGDYVVISIGGSKEAFTLSSTPNDSLLAKDEMSFVDAYADKKLISMIHGDKALWECLYENGQGISDYAVGFRDGMIGAANKGSIRDIEEMLRIVIEREKALLELGSADDFGMVAYVEEGLKVESFGGYNSGALDLQAPTQLSHLADRPDTALFFSGISNPAYDSAATEYAEAMATTLYSTALKLTEMKIESEEFEQFKKYALQFDNELREDVVGLYSAMNKGSGALGNESAMVIDLKGSMPAIPGIPQELVDNAKAPRIAIISPVQDRKKLAKTWEEMNSSTASLLGKISKMSGKKIPMQKPISSEKDDMTTWFFSFPFFQDDFLPSVTVSDKWFAASTSKSQATDLISQAKVGGKAGSGMRFYMNFEAIRTYAESSLAVVNEQSAQLFSEEQRAEFDEAKPKLIELLDAMKDFDSLNWTVNQNNGRKHSSVHLKTK
jgi:hypothetical protein